MKFLFLFIILFSVSACLPNQDQYKYERGMMECLTLQETNSAISIMNWWHDIEDVLLEQNLLKNNTGNAYRVMFKTLSDDTNDVFMSAFEEAILSVNRLDYDNKCDQFVNNQNELFLKDSRWHKLRKIFLKGEGDSFQELSSIFSSIYEAYTKNDFKQPYIRFITLYQVYSIYLENNEDLYLDYEHNRTVWSEEEPTLASKKDHNILNIYLNKEEQIFLYDKRITLDSLRGYIRNFLLQKCDSVGINVPLLGQQSKKLGLLLLQQEPETNYSAVEAVYNIINETYQEIWEETAQISFNRSYLSLDSKRRKVIQTMYPFALYTPGDFKDF